MIFAGRQLMRNRKHWTDIFTRHTRDVANLVDGNRIKLTYKPSGLWTYRYTCSAIDASVPVEVEDYGWVFHKRILNFVTLGSPS